MFTSVRSRAATVAVLTGLVLSSGAASAFDDAGESPATAARLPGPGFEVAIGPVGPRPARIDPSMLTAIVSWLSATYDLPSNDRLPGVAFVPGKAMAALRHATTESPDRVPPQRPSTDGHASDLVSLYDDGDRIIYLPLDWSGGTAAELSMLVHEMVHHLQNAAGLIFACPESREKLAYAAQRDWLALSGRDFFEVFETDPFSLMVRTECAF